jgi:hypothetical protein
VNDDGNRLPYLKTHVDDSWSARRAERLRVSIRDDELDPGQAGGDHIVDRVAAGASYAAHHDAGLQFLQSGGLQTDSAYLASPVGLRVSPPPWLKLARQGVAFPPARALRRVSGSLRPIVASLETSLLG